MKPGFLLILSALLCLQISCKENSENKVLATHEETRQWKPEDTRSLTGVMEKRGLIKKTEGASPGYLLFQPSTSTTSYLVNKDGQVVHEWKGEMNSMNSYFLPNGNLIRLERDPDFPTFAAGGQAGRIREYDWEGNMVWDFHHATETELIHHDIEVMPNGNILAISYEVISPEEAVKAGRDPAHLPKAGLWPDKIIEIEPQRPEGGNIVWEWRMWDHLVQELDSTKKNYGKVAENPRKINLNPIEEGEGGGPPMTQERIDQMIKMDIMTSNATVDNLGSDITHTNAVAYNAELDQIAISVPGYSEIFIIDHSTTTEEARGSTGGKWGQGGDLLYRWGNPKNYGRGGKEDQQLFEQHDIKWIPEGYPGAGKLMVFNNDIPHPDNKLPSMWAALANATSADIRVPVGDVGNYSAVHEWAPPVANDGSYIIPEDAPIGPSEADWTYTAPDKYSFYSAFISGAHRLKNGNTLITSGKQGRFFEVTPDKRIVWEYWNPYKHDYRLPDGTSAQPIGPFLYNQFRGTHLDTDHPGLEGKELQPIDPQPKPFIYKPPPAPPAGEKDSLQ